MKFKITLLELIIIWLASYVAQNNGKVVGNINDDADGGTLTIVDIEDDNKTVYYNQNFELGHYNYGYDVKPSGPVGQFHHENRSPAEVVYGCYGYEGPDNMNHMTFYISDAWGYRPVRQEQDVEIFYPADNPEGTGHMNGTPTKWADLFFPDMCAHFAERLASSSNVVTKPPIQPVSSANPFVTAALPLSTVSPSSPALTSFGSRTPPVPSGSFDVIQFNVPSTIGPQPTSGRLTTGPQSTSGRLTTGPQPTSGRLTTTTTAAGGPSTITTSGFPTTLRAQPTHNTNSPLQQASNNNVVPNLPSSAGTTTASLPNGGTRSTPLGSFTGSSRFSVPTSATAGPSRPGFTGGVGSTGTPSSFSPLDVTDSESSNNGPLTPSRGGSTGRQGRPTSGPTTSTTTGGASPSHTSTPFIGNAQFSRLIPTPTEPSLGHEQSTSNTQTFPSSQNNRFVTTRSPTTNFNSLSRTTTTASPDASVTGSQSSNSGTVPAPGRQRPAGSGGSYGASGDNDDDNDTVGSNGDSSSISTRVPLRSSTSGGRNPTGSITLLTEPASSGPTLATTGGTSQHPSTNNFGVGSSLAPPTPSGSGRTSTGGDSNSRTRQPTGAAASGTSSTFRPVSGFSGTFNNPSTLQPSSSNQQTNPGNPTTFNPTGQPGTAATAQRDSNRFSTTFRQNIPTTGIPQEPSTGVSPSYSPAPTTRGSSTFSTPSGPSSFSVNIPTTQTQFTFNRPASTGALVRNATSGNTASEEFCASQCSSCSTPQPTQPTQQQKQQQPAFTDEDYLQIPGALLSSIPVILYPDCGANAFSRPAIVPFCPSQQTQCNNNHAQQPLFMRFPDAPSFILGPNGIAGGPVARNAFVANQGSNRVTRKVRRGRQQRLATL